jgi:muramidase (phage lysozyme)
MSPATLLICAAAAAALYLVRHQAEEGVCVGVRLLGTPTFPETSCRRSRIASPSITDAFTSVDPAAVGDANVAAFLHLIRYGESSNSDRAYSTLYGGGQFSDFSQHPGIFFTLPDGRRTSAAGAYQITKTTWDSLRSYNLPDFSPASQDFAAVCLIKRRGAYSDVLAGRFDTAIRKCQNEWTSLPGAKEARYGLDKAHQILLAYGGQFQGSYA